MSARCAECGKRRGSDPEHCEVCWDDAMDAKPTPRCQLAGERANLPGLRRLFRGALS